MPAVAAHYAAGGDAENRNQFSNLRALLMLSMLMTESGDEGKILRLAATSMPSFGRCHLIGVYLAEGGVAGNRDPVRHADDPHRGGEATRLPRS